MKVLLSQVNRIMIKGQESFIKVSTDNRVVRPEDRTGKDESGVLFH